MEIADYFDSPTVCPVCYQVDDDCLCQPCPDCGAVGDPTCYQELDHEQCQGHLALLSSQQRESRQEHESDLEAASREWDEEAWFYMEPFLEEEEEDANG